MGGDSQSITLILYFHNTTRLSEKETIFWRPFNPLLQHNSYIVGTSNYSILIIFNDMIYWPSPSLEKALPKCAKKWLSLWILVVTYNHNKSPNTIPDSKHFNLEHISNIEAKFTSTKVEVKMQRINEKDTFRSGNLKYWFG